MACYGSQISGNNSALTTTMARERPKSAKHGIRLRMVDPNNQSQPDPQRHEPTTTTVMESDLEERMETNKSRPKSAKFKSRRTENTSGLEDEDHFFGSRPKSAKHGRRARNAQRDISNQNGNPGNHDSYQRNHDQRVERVHIVEGISAGRRYADPSSAVPTKICGNATTWT